MHVKMGWICPMRQSAPFGNQMGPNVHAVWQSPSSRTEKIPDFFKKIFSTFFRTRWGAFRSFRAVGHILWLAYSLMVLVASGRPNAAWDAENPLILKYLPICGIYGHILRYRGHIQ